MSKKARDKTVIILNILTYEKYDTKDTSEELFVFLDVKLYEDHNVIIGYEEQVKENVLFRLLYTN